MQLRSSWDSDAPLVIAHRGASAYAPENTLAAFKKAVELGADAIELDAKLSADGYVVVHHDRTLNRTTDGVGPIARYRLEELRRLDAGGSFGVAFTGERIPTLGQVCRGFGDQLLINIELTNYAAPLDPLPETVVRLVRKYNLEDRVLLSSFNPLALIRSQKVASEIPGGLLVMTGLPRCIRASLRCITPHKTFHPHHELIDRKMVQACHDRGQRVHVWTVNDPGRMRELLEAGVDGLITDVPDKARQVVDDWIKTNSLSVS